MGLAGKPQWAKISVLWFDLWKRHLLLFFSHTYTYTYFSNWEIYGDEANVGCLSAGICNGCIDGWLFELLQIPKMIASTKIDFYKYLVSPLLKFKFKAKSF